MRRNYYTSLVAKYVNLSDPQQRLISVGAFLDDVGLTALDVPRRDRATVHTVREGDVRGHTEMGRAILHVFGGPAEVIQILAYHHERYDGSGFLEGLQGDGIPLFARLVHLAEAFDQLTTGVGPYPPLSPEDAYADLLREAGTLYDPTLTRQFVEFFSTTAPCTHQLAACFKPVLLP